MGQEPTIERCIDWATIHEEADFYQTEALQTELRALRQVREAALAHIAARDAYFNQYARQSGWHEGRLLDDGSEVRATWAILRGLVGIE